MTRKQGKLPSFVKTRLARGLKIAAVQVLYGAQSLERRGLDNTRRHSIKQGTGFFLLFWLCPDGQRGSGAPVRKTGLPIGRSLARAGWSQCEWEGFVPMVLSHQ